MTRLGVTLPVYKTCDQYRCCSIVTCTMYVDNRIMCSVPVTEGTVCVYFGDVSFTRISLYPRANRTCRETCSSGVRAKLILHGMFARMPNKQ